MMVRVCVCQLDCSIQSQGSLPFSRVLYTYSFNVRVHGRIGLNASLFSRERRRTLVSCMSWRAFTVVLLFTGASILARVAFFAPPSPDIQKCLSRVATAAPFYSERRKIRAREDEGIIIYIAVKPEFYCALSSDLNVTNPMMSKSSRIFPFTCNVVSAPVWGDG